MKNFKALLIAGLLLLVGGNCFAQEEYNRDSIWGLEWNFQDSILTVGFVASFPMDSLPTFIIQNFEGGFYDVYHQVGMSTYNKDVWRDSFKEDFFTDSLKVDSLDKYLTHITFYIKVVDPRFYTVPEDITTYWGFFGIQFEYSEDTGHYYSEFEPYKDDYTKNSKFLYFDLLGKVSSTEKDTIPETHENVQNCKNLYKEDFGGNSTDDPAYGGPELPEGLVSGLTYSSHLWDMGNNSYGIRKIAVKGSPKEGEHIYDTWYADFGDHTHEGDTTIGYFMQIDFAEDSNERFFSRQIDGLPENTELNFSIWAHPVNATSSNKIILAIEDLDGNILSQQQYVIDYSIYGWQQLILGFKTAAGMNSVVYRIGFISGNGDFAIDDIEILQCNDRVGLTETYSDNPIITPTIITEGFVVTGKPEKVEVLSINGVVMASFSAQDYYNISNLYNGTYIVAVTTTNGERDFVKIIKR